MKDSLARRVYQTQSKQNLIFAGIFTVLCKNFQLFLPLQKIVQVNDDIF
jgi:hypothetical protein